MALVPDALTRPAARIGAAAQNALEVARFGGLETDEEPSPYEVVAESSVHRLRRYYAIDDLSANGGSGEAADPRAPKADRPAIALVPPMMLAAEVWDVAPSASAVTDLYNLGLDPFVIDFGAPEHEEGGLERTLTDHVVAVSEAIDQMVAIKGGKAVHIGGYSQGGMFCYQAAAYRRSKDIASVVVFGSPVDTRGALSFGLPEDLLVRGAAALADNVLARRALPAWLSRTGFRLMDPAKSLRQRIQFLRQLHDRDALLPRERQRRFLEAEGWVAWPGPALAEVVRQFGVHNRMVRGGFVIEDRLVTLADMTSPILAFVGTTDDIAPPHTVRSVAKAAPRAEVYEVPLKAGHFGLVVGSTAAAGTWPKVAEWARWLSADGPKPEGMERIEADLLPERVPSRADQLGARVELVAGAGLGAAQALAGAALGASRTMRELAGAASGQFGRLNRIGRMRPGTKISLGLLLAEQAAEAPDDICFLWQDRAHTQADVNGRIDNVVKGLLEIGVRQGEHVGVLMQARPSGLTVIAALNRLGAVAVLMRPDGAAGREAELGQVRRIIADPDNADTAKAETEAQVFVLGVGGDDREIPPGLVDMERIDPDAVKVPAWYRPNPGRASDLAFVLFTGTGERTRANRITNGRWALSAFGTASSAALSKSDTVYSATPIYHPSALLMSFGGAIAAGSRIALATQFEPKTFWDEIRRYGATIVSYTWTMLDEIAEAPPHPGERHHPVRLFIGSGMPRGLWRRVNERFAPARVLEFYASTEGDAILVNLTGEKPGSMGRPLPGSAEVRLAAFDTETRQLAEGEDGFAIPCARHDAGLLLSRVRPEAIMTAGSPLRGVFEAGDAWLSTGDLFRRDLDGEYWMVDHVPALMRTAKGAVAARPIQDALADVDEIRLAIAYAVKADDGVTDIPLAAVTLRHGRTLDPVALDEALGELGDGRPLVVHVVDEIPVTTWYRPVSRPLRALGIPSPSKPARAWHLDERSGSYRPLTKAARSRLLSV